MKEKYNNKFINNSNSVLSMLNRNFTLTNMTKESPVMVKTAKEGKLISINNNDSNDVSAGAYNNKNKNTVISNNLKQKLLTSVSLKPSFNDIKVTKSVQEKENDKNDKNSNDKDIKVVYGQSDNCSSKIFRQIKINKPMNIPKANSNSVVNSNNTGNNPNTTKGDNVIKPFNCSIKLNQIQNNCSTTSNNKLQSQLLLDSNTSPENNNLLLKNTNSNNNNKKITNNSTGNNNKTENLEIKSQDKPYNFTNCKSFLIRNVETMRSLKFNLSCSTEKRESIYKKCIQLIQSYGNSHLVFSINQAMEFQGIYRICLSSGSEKDISKAVFKRIYSVTNDMPLMFTITRVTTLYQFDLKYSQLIQLSRKEYLDSCFEISSVAALVIY